MFRPNNARYIIDKDSRTVVCISEGHTQDVLNIIAKYLADKRIGIAYTDLYINDKFIGIAKCHPEDEWDELIGKQVAYSKMCTSYSGAINKAIADTARRLTLAANLISSKKSNI